MLTVGPVIVVMFGIGVMMSMVSSMFFGGKLLAKSGSMIRSDFVENGYRHCRKFVMTAASHSCLHGLSSTVRFIVSLN